MTKLSSEVDVFISRAELSWTQRMLVLKDQAFISSQIPTEGGEATDSQLVFLLCA